MSLWTVSRRFCVRMLAAGRHSVLSLAVDVGNAVLTLLLLRVTHVGTNESAFKRFACFHCMTLR